MTKEKYKKGDTILVPSLVHDVVLCVDSDPIENYLWASDDEGIEYCVETSLIKRKLKKHEARAEY